jgi:hypothetical protein
LASDQLVDALFAWGDADRIADRVNEHLTAGANHVCLQVIGTGPPGSADFNALRAAWRKLAEALL